MTAPVEEVVLLADDGTPIGVADKAAVHTEDTALHLAFSCHVYDRDGRLLVTRRALAKRTWPGVWTNSFCGHPGPGEAMLDAVRRRAQQELGLELASLEVALPDFRYRATSAEGIVENEICPVYRAVAANAPEPNPDEVVEYAWADPTDVLDAAARTPFAYSPWITLQLPALDEAGLLHR